MIYNIHLYSYVQHLIEFKNIENIQNWLFTLKTSPASKRKACEKMDLHTEQGHKPQRSRSRTTHKNTKNPVQTQSSKIKTNNIWRKEIKSFWSILFFFYMSLYMQVKTGWYGLNRGWLTASKTDLMVIGKMNTILNSALTHIYWHHLCNSRGTDSQSAHILSFTSPWVEVICAV